MASQSPPTIDDLRELAKQVDSGKAVEVESEEPDEVAEPSEVESSTTEEKAPTQDEIEEAAQAAEKDKAESSDTTEEEKVSVTKEQKDQERYDRNWKKLEARKAELERKEKELAEKEKEFKPKPKDLKDETDKDGYSVKDYEYAAKKFADDGQDDLAKEAAQKGQNLFYQGFQREWRANMNELIEEHPDLSDSRKPFTVKCDQVLNQLPFLKTLPDGCKYAVRIALGETGSSMVSELKAENAKLKKEVERLNKATRLSGSLPSRMPTGKSFDDMSAKDRLEYLREQAEAVDRGEL
jgi:hypothetical protein